MKHLAIDFGAKRIGLAVSDPDGKMAFAHATHERAGHKRDCASLVQTVRGLAIEAIVFGLPRALSENTVSESETKVRTFAAILQDALSTANLDVPIFWQDERFSTREALSAMRDAGVSQKQGRSGDANGTDARAAAIILQAFLDRTATKSTPESGRTFLDSEADS